MMKIFEPAREVPVHEDCDICVLGGSCTGVFAAVRAARLGARVVLIEKMNAFGGVATNGMVNIWHSLKDTVFKRDIIGGLTVETIDRLKRRDAVFIKQKSSGLGAVLNSEELKIELDALVLEHKIVPMLHTMYCGVAKDGDHIDAVFIENKDGRTAVRAKVFIDATGDGDLAMHAGVPWSTDPHLQPPTTCAKIRNLVDSGTFRKIYDAHHAEFDLAKDLGWQTFVPGLDGISMCAQTHVFGVDVSKAQELTDAEIEGRRQMRAVLDMLRKYGPQEADPGLVGLASHIGTRQTRRFEADYTLTEEDVLWGRRFPDAIANGSYRVDIHYPDGGGFLFKDLDGTQWECRPGGSVGRWRDPIDKDPTFYQIPYRTMIHRCSRNLIMAGRMIAADRGAFGAIRVMVNLNQVGEAAGVAAALAANSRSTVHEIQAKSLRAQLADGGSIKL